MSRLGKFRKKRKFILISKILLISYIFLFGFSYLASSTGAYYSSNSGDSFTFQAGTWWDGSDLVFTGKGNQNIKSCPPIEITVGMKNKGFSMTDTSEYEVFYVETGEPKINGEKIATGIIQPIEADAETQLTYEAEEEGFYMFKAIQRDGYEGTSSKEIWSEKIKVNCKDKEKNNTDEKTDETETQDTEDVSDVEENKEGTSDEESIEKNIEDAQSNEPKDENNPEPSEEDEQIPPNGQPEGDEESSNNSESNGDVVTGEGEETGDETDEEAE
ncbi:amyloid fiber anchoring/assembly protein TapA [Ornithinibacillus salinisoli]|uniref:Amyloid fiber anchoring/assembly protein TapA n=1 Tax=Ornithinibacillus salinisoli TaxID=1848459 RepID=A0ABW4W1M7_9BACI